MAYHQWKNKDAWVASRKRGDTICDGRGEHRMIVDISTYDDLPRWVITMGIWLHEKVSKWRDIPTADWVENRWLDLCGRFGIKTTRTCVEWEVDDGWGWDSYDSCNEPQQNGSCHEGNLA